MLIIEILFLFIVIISNYIVGNLALNFVSLGNLRKYEKQFFAQLLGIIITVTLYAIAKTEFNTIFILIPIILVVLIKRQKFDIDMTASIKSLGLLIVVSIALYFTAHYFFYTFMDGVVFGDNHFYANIAYYLKTRGIETTNFDWTIEGNIPATPYHFFEGWFTALWSSLFNMNTLRTYYLIYIPITGAILFHGAFVLAGKILRPTQWRIVMSLMLALIFLFLQPFDFPFLQITSKFVSFGSWFHNIKFSIVYLIVMAALILWLNKSYKPAFIFLLLLVPLYSPTAAAILSLLAVTIISMFIRKKIDKKRALLAIIALFVIGVLYILFYYIQPSSETPIVFAELRFISVLFKVAKLMAKMLIFVFAPLILLFMVVHLLLRKQNTELINNGIEISLLKDIGLGIVGAFIVLAMLVPLYFYVDHDAFQLLFIFIIPIFSIALYITIIILLNASMRPIVRLFSIIVMLGYFLLLLWQNPAVSFNMERVDYFEPICDTEYLENIKKATAEDNTANFSYFRHYSDGRHPMELKPFLFVPDNRIIHFRNDYVPICLSTNDLPDEVDVRYCNKNHFAFYRYCKANLQNSLDENYLNFIKKHNIKFVIVESGATLPTVLEEHINWSCTNKINKNKFIVLK